MSEPLILIAEDERDIRELIMITLQLSGFNVVANKFSSAVGRKQPKKGFPPPAEYIKSQTRLPLLQQAPKHHQLQCPGSEPCFQVWYVLARAEQL